MFRRFSGETVSVVKQEERKKVKKSSVKGRLPVWHKHTLETQSGTNLSLCGNVGGADEHFPTICLQAQPVCVCPSHARRLSTFSPVSSLTLASHPPLVLTPDAGAPTRIRGNGLRCLCRPWLPRRPSSHSSGPSIPLQEKHTGPWCQNFPPMFSLFLFSLAFSAAPVLCVQCAMFGVAAPCQKKPTQPHARTHTHMRTHAVTDTQLGPSCTQRQGFGNQ